MTTQPGAAAKAAAALVFYGGNVCFRSEDQSAPESLDHSEHQSSRACQPIGIRTGLRLDAPFYCVHSHPARWSPCFVSTDRSCFGFLLLLLALTLVKICMLDWAGLPGPKTKPVFVSQEMTAARSRYEHLSCLFRQVSFALIAVLAFASGEPGHRSLFAS